VPIQKFTLTTVKVVASLKEMASLAPCNYGKTCQLYLEVPKLIYYITIVKDDKYFN